MKKFYTISLGTTNLISLDDLNVDDDFIQSLTFLYKYCEVSRILGQFSKFIFSVAYKFKQHKTKNPYIFSNDNFMFNKICICSYNLIIELILDKTVNFNELYEYDEFLDKIPSLGTAMYPITFRYEDKSNK